MKRNCSLFQFYSSTVHMVVQWPDDLEPMCILRGLMNVCHVSCCWHISQQSYGADQLFILKLLSVTDNLIPCENIWSHWLNIEYFNIIYLFNCVVVSSLSCWSKTNPLNNVLQIWTLQANGYLRCKGLRFMCRMTPYLYLESTIWGASGLACHQMVSKIVLAWPHHLPPTSCFSGFFSPFVCPWLSTSWYSGDKLDLLLAWWSRTSCLLALW